MEHLEFTQTVPRLPPLPELNPQAASHIKFVVGQDEQDNPCWFVQRTFPAPHHGIELCPDDATQLAEEAPRHFNMLAVRKPTIYRTEIRSEYWQSYIDTEVEFVPHRPLAFNGAIPPKDYPVALDVAAALLDYLHWVCGSRQRMFLSDCAKLSQYGIAADGKAVILDTDAHMRPATSQNIRCSLAKLSEWVKPLGSEGGQMARQAAYMAGCLLRF